MGTVTRRAAAISQAHHLAGFDSPIWHIAVAQGIRRAKRTVQTDKRPVVTRICVRWRGDSIST